MASENIRFGVIGAGLLARATHIPNLLQTEGAVLQVCCDIDDSALAECRKLAPNVEISKDHRKVIHDPSVDALVIATTEKFRIPLIEEATRAGKPVYCEKPLAQNLQEAMHIQKLVEDAGIPFCVGHNRRCSPAMVDAQRIFSNHMKNPAPCPWRYRREAVPLPELDRESGRAGISIHINDDWWSWKAVHMQGQNAQIGLLLSENTHFVDIACWFLQSEPVEVMTVFSGMLLHQVSITFANGHLASIMSCANGSFGAPKEFYVAMGNGGVVVVDHMLEVRTAGIAEAPLIQTYPMLNDRHPDIGGEGLHGWLRKKHAACQEAAATGDFMRQFSAEPDKGHMRMLREFVREIRGEREPISPVQAAVRSVRVCCASVKSKEQKRPVLLSELVN